MSNKQISTKIKAEYKLDIPPSTLSTWWNAANKINSSNVAPDRINPDVRYNARQRPDILVDMEHILQRKCKAVAITGVPYSQEVVRLLAIHIYHKLVAYNIYNPRGQRKQQHLQLQEDIVHSVEHARLLTRYLANSTPKTEYHKSMRRERNVNGFRFTCKKCPRCFKRDIKFSLH